MISEIYNNKLLYYNMMNNFLHGKITAWNFRQQYWSQRHNDLNQEEKNGYTYERYKNKIQNLINNEKKFKKEYVDILYEKGSTKLGEYEKGAKELNIKGELFFMGLWNFIDDYVREYYPSDNEGFDPVSDVDEQKLTKIIQVVFDVLERNKERWECGQNENIKI